jgi:SsrA-binding protein
MLMKAKKAAPAKIITNARARFDYELKDTFMAGLVLSGAETKSLRMGRGHLKGAFVNIKDGELWLNNATITPNNTNAAHLTEDTQTRARKLLVKKRELSQLQAAKEQGLTIVPTKLLTKGRYIKIEIATAKGKKKYDKRQAIKARDTGRDIMRELKRN